MKKFFAVVFTYTLLILADGLLTYINTPDLSREGNPLVTVFNLGWGALFIANLICYIVYVLLAYYSFAVYKTQKCQAKNALEYACFVFYDRYDKPQWLLYKTPKHIRPFAALFGYCFSYSLIAGRAVLVLEWLGVTFKADMTAYRKFESFFLGRPEIFLVVAVCIIFGIRWFSLELKKSREI